MGMSGDYAIAIEELSKIDNSCSVIMSAHNSLVCWGLETYGEEEVKEKYLPQLASGKMIGAFCLSELVCSMVGTSAGQHFSDNSNHVLNFVRMRAVCQSFGTNTLVHEG